MPNRYERLPDQLWKIIEPFLPPDKPRPIGGRKPISWRQVMDGVHYRLWTGCQREAIPSGIIYGKTCHRRFRELVHAQTFEQIYAALLRHYDRKKGLRLQWPSFDSSLTKAPQGAKTGPSPTDRAKTGVILHLFVDQKCIPLSVGITGANVHDKHPVAEVLDSARFRAARGPRRPRHLCMDKGYDYADADFALRERRIQPRIRRRGKHPLLGSPRGKPKKMGS